jgi:hypothetical protein
VLKDNATTDTANGKGAGVLTLYVENLTEEFYQWSMIMGRIMACISMPMVEMEVPVVIARYQAREAREEMAVLAVRQQSFLSEFIFEDVDISIQLT